MVDGRENSVHNTKNWDVVHHRLSTLSTIYKRWNFSVFEL